MSTAELEQLYESWQAARDRRDTESQIAQIKAARQLTASAKAEFWSWLAGALHNEQRKWFVAKFFDSYPVPKRMLKEMIRAGVYEKDPSYNRLFIERCVRSFGSTPTCEELLRYLEFGSDVEKAGAASALYWARDTSHNDAPPELREQIRCQLLKAFVNNPDVRVRQRIIPMLALANEHYPRHVQPRVAQAIAIARSHADEYIRHRVEIQLGTSCGPLMSLPRNDEPK
jgi:hypothetical protein